MFHRSNCPAWSAARFSPEAAKTSDTGGHLNGQSPWIEVMTKKFGNGWEMFSTSFEARLIEKSSSTKLEADVVEVSSLFGLNKAWQPQPLQLWKHCAETLNFAKMGKSE